jgi:hypothetical protein
MVCLGIDWRRHYRAHLILDYPGARHWLFSMIETMRKKEDLIQLLVKVWTIWHAKRKAFHEDIFQSLFDTMEFVHRKK